jgi:hypothetical protein
LPPSRRFESYLAGAVMLLLGLILISYLVGLIGGSQIPAVFLIGVGVIFSLMAVMKTKVPGSYEMSPRTTLAYGALALVIGVLWISLSVEAVLAGYALAAMLVFFGLVFLAYTRIRRPSA